MKKPEVLAPAGSMEALIAAIEAGCDAVYIGGYVFGARSYANNFSNEEIIEAINYAHKYDVKVYITVNTLIYENEVPMFLEYIDFLHKNNVDAIIVQDIGMMDLLRKTYPNLEIHASTQMHIHNLEGVKLLESLGIARVVLARETPIEVIKEIKEQTNIEIEIFVHGALCISYSGQCLMSSLIGGRSGNRGTCAGSCRQTYDLMQGNKKINTDKYLLSTKDLNTLEYVGKLIEIGVDSLKIEGRMKRAEYVYSVVKIYSESVDEYLKKGKITISDNEINDLKKIFNRGFTKGFMFNEKNNDYVNQKRPNHMGVPIGKIIDVSDSYITIKLNDQLSVNDGIRIVGTSDVGFVVNQIFKNKNKVLSAYNNDTITLKTKESVNIGSQVLKTTDYNQLTNINKRIKEKTRKLKINGKFIGKLNNNIVLEISYKDYTIEVRSDYIVEKAEKNSTQLSDILEKLNRLGSTPYIFENLEVYIDEGIFIPTSVINNLRQEAIKLINEKRIFKSKYIKTDYHSNLPDFKVENNLNLLIKDFKIYEKIDETKFNKIYINEDFKDILTERLTPRLSNVILNHKDYNTDLLVSELGSVAKYKNVDTDFSLNVTNSYSVAFLHEQGVNKITLSYELTYEQVKDIVEGYFSRYRKHPNLEIIIYSQEEVMTTKFNLLEMYNLKEGYIKDRFDNLYPIRYESKYMKIYNYKNRIDKSFDKYFKIGVNNCRIDLLTMSNLDEITKANLI